MRSDEERQIIQLLDEHLPVWVTAGEAERLDNNFWAPAGFEARRELERLQREGAVSVHEFGELFADGGLETGVSPCEDGSLGVLEGHNLRPNFVFPVYTKYADDAGPELRAGDLLLGKDGEPGSVAVVTQELLDFDSNIALGGHVYRMRLARGYREHSYFLALFLNSRLGQALVRTLIAGGTTPTIRTADLRSLQVCLPTALHLAQSHAAEETIRRLQASVIATVANVKCCSDLLSQLQAVPPRSRLPINWSGGGRSDPHGYDRT